MNNPNLPTIMGSQIRLSNDMFLMAAESVNERTIRILVFHQLVYVNLIISSVDVLGYSNDDLW